MPQTIITIDDKVIVCDPWDCPHTQPPYVQYAVTVLDGRSLNRHKRLAATKHINWYGFPINPHVEWL